MVNQRSAFSTRLLEFDLHLQNTPSDPHPSVGASSSSQAPNFEHWQVATQTLL